MSTNNEEFLQALKEARRWPHGSRLHSDGMELLYNLFLKANGYYASFDQLWDWSDAMELNIYATQIIGLLADAPNNDIKRNAIDKARQGLLYMQRKSTMKGTK